MTAPDVAWLMTPPPEMPGVVYASVNGAVATELANYGWTIEPLVRASEVAHALDAAREAGGHVVRMLRSMRANGDTWVTFEVGSVGWHYLEAMADACAALSPKETP